MFGYVKQIQSWDSGSRQPGGTMDEFPRYKTRQGVSLQGRRTARLLYPGAIVKVTCNNHDLKKEPRNDLLT